MSYPWADEPRNHGVVMAYGDDQEAVGKAAEALAQHFWKVREQFEFVAPTTYLDDALEQALVATKSHLSSAIWGITRRPGALGT